jgi:putative hydrolase of the HAD superfamily
VIEAVLFDFGGVVTTSPFDNFARLEERRGVPADTIRRINSTNPDTNAWAQYERNDVDVAGFCELFEAEAAAIGYEIPGQEVLDCLKTEIRPFMLDAIRRIREHYRTAMLTNNFSAGDDPGSGSHGGAKELFEVIIESSKAGVRKPTPRFYELACEALDVEPSACVFLDDLGINLKPARAMGMTTIKVVDPHVALAELGTVLGMDFSTAS